MKGVLLCTVASVLMLAGTCSAQPVNIPVSCSVPSIPGVNAPLLEKNAEIAAAGLIAKEQKADGAAKRLVKTYYAR
jgi:hypothetical protein